MYRYISSCESPAHNWLSEHLSFLLLTTTTHAHRYLIEVQRRLYTLELSSVKEFNRLVRLVFQNCIAYGNDGGVELMKISKRLMRKFNGLVSARIKGLKAATRVSKVNLKHVP